MNYTVGVDIGGTFTDLISVDETGNPYVVKIPYEGKDASKYLKGKRDVFFEEGRRSGRDRTENHCHSCPSRVHTGSG